MLIDGVLDGLAAALLHVGDGDEPHVLLGQHGAEHELATGPRPMPAVTIRSDAATSPSRPGRAAGTIAGNVAAATAVVVRRRNSRRVVGRPGFLSTLIRLPCLEGRSIAHREVGFLSENWWI